MSLVVVIVCKKKQSMQGRRGSSRARKVRKRCDDVKVMKQAR